MKKSDLKTGMVVELANGRRGLVVVNNCYGEDGIIYSNDNWSGLDAYDEDLTWNFVGPDSQLDVVKVYKPSTPNNFLNFKTLKDHLFGTMKLIWERKVNTVTVSVHRSPEKTVTTTVQTVYH